ncbi:MAG: substrate-binding domain-containing protein [Oscillospiraceae bacterium]|nr:substrate-binding domain-containing protein [Oscillospiraceae bacterium]
MKTIKITALILVGVMALSACETQTAQPVVQTETPTQTQSEQRVEPPIIQPDELIAPEVAREFLEENFSEFNIDGSTSMLPLHESLNEEFGDEEYISHSRTVEAFEKLIAGENDILLGVDFSDELLKMAEDAGVDLEMKAITREAFVFLINVNNPVKSLTMQQIKDIYSGQVTNWSEVGGDDEPIAAFQRNSDSGSQIRMVKFMGDTPLAEVDVVYHNMMGTVIESIGDYDEGKYSIAYNMYTFTEKQFYNEDVIMLEVDGIAPTDETIFSDAYPLVIFNYLYYDKNNEKAAEFAENLYAFLMGDEGQKLISEAGYVNLNVNYDRNLDVSAPFEYADGTAIEFYDEETGLFYDAEDNELLVFESYPDYVLRDSEYKDNAKAREFLNDVFDNPEIAVTSFSVRLNPEEGTLRVNFWSPVVFEVENFFNYLYEDKYYSFLEYHIETEKFVLESGGQLTLDSYSELLAPFSEYLEGFEPDITIELTREDLSNLYVRTVEYHDYSVEYPDYSEGETVELTYVLPF